MLRRLEDFVLFFAMILAVTLEGACVYWMFGPPRLYPTPDNSLNLVGEWTGLALPQGWLLGALHELSDRLLVMFVPRRTGTVNELLQNRRSFLRLWRLAMALLAMQGLALFLGRAVTMP